MNIILKTNLLSNPPTLHSLIEWLVMDESVGFHFAVNWVLYRIEQINSNNVNRRQIYN